MLKVKAGLDSAVDALGAQGQPVVFRHEGARGRGRRDQADSLGGSHPGQRGRRQGATRVAARQRDGATRQNLNNHGFNLEVDHDVLLTRGKSEVYGDQAYQGQNEAIQQRAPKAEDKTNRRWRTKLREHLEVKEQNRIKSKTRSRVEHVFAIMKLRFGFTRVRDERPSPNCAAHRFPYPAAP